MKTQKQRHALPVLLPHAPAVRRQQPEVLRNEVHRGRHVPVHGGAELGERPGEPLEERGVLGEAHAALQGWEESDHLSRCSERGRES